MTTNNACPLIKALLAHYEEEALTIKESGPIAAKGMWLQLYPSGGVSYVRGRVERDGVTTQKALGREGGEKHVEFLEAMKRRDRLAVLEERLSVLKGWLEDD